MTEAEAQAFLDSLMPSEKIAERAARMIECLDGMPLVSGMSAILALSMQVLMQAADSRMTFDAQMLTFVTALHEMWKAARLEIPEGVDGEAATKH